MDPLLGSCSLAELRQRKSFKWRTFPPDVLPAFVAEMDFTLAEPITEAVTAALALGDSGYAHMGELGEAFARFAAGRFGWRPDLARMFAIPDVMTGLAEVVEAITPPGAGIVVNPPVYPPFRFRFGFYGRRIIDAPLARDPAGRYHLDPDAIEAAQQAKDAFRADAAAADPAAPPRGTHPGKGADELERASQGSALLHVLEEVTQHLGQMELTRDVLRATASPS